MADGRTTRVLVVSSDPRVAGALTAAVDAVSGFVACGAYGTACDVEEVLTKLRPHVAVVDVTRSHSARDLRLLRRLSRRLPVVAMCDCRTLRTEVVSRGVVCCCDQDGDLDTLTAAVLEVARTGE